MNKIFFFFALLSQYLLAQNFSKKDTLLGSNTKYRDFWNVQKYDIEIEPDFATKSLKGKNKISFNIIKNTQNPTLQIDLQQPMKMDDFQTNLKITKHSIEGNFIFFEIEGGLKTGENYFIDIQFSGNPKIAQNAPWDGGWVFTKDKNGNPWMSVACEGQGASVWIPIKELWADEPDKGSSLKIITPKDLIGVGNGRLISTTEKDNKNIFHWEVRNPINSYNIIPYIGKYVHFKEDYMGEKGKLDLNYWVLDYNLDKAKKQFEQVKPMLKALEYWFGPYPFYEDSYKMVESPYLGMEHQSNIAYGNNYENGYLGRDLSDTGVGLQWDFIIIHESGHEWFGNNITAKDQADMWIHEGFTSYSETLFTEQYLDKKSANQYIVGIRNMIQNDKPIIGKYGVRKTGSGDQYYKGANMLHTIRQIINNDEKFRSILRGLNKDFYHQTVTTQQVEKYISEKAGIDFSTIFDVYLRSTEIPMLEYQQKGKVLKYRWDPTFTKKGMKMPIKISSHGIFITPTEKWKSITLKNNKKIEVDENYYINYAEVLP